MSALLTLDYLAERGRIVPLDSPLPSPLPSLASARSSHWRTASFWQTARQYDATIWTMDAALERVAGVKYIPKQK